jgi:chemotaxis protein MotB
MITRTSMKRALWSLGVICLLELTGSGQALAAGLSPEEVRFGPAALTFSAGFIRTGMPQEGMVVRARDDRRLNGPADLVYLQLSNPSEVSPGDAFTVYRSIRKVFHPTSGDYVGDLISIRGVVRVTSIAKNIAAAKIVRAYDAITQGEVIMRFASTMEDSESGSARSALDSPGMVIDVQYQGGLIGQRNIAYVDLGRRDGLQAGDTLELIRTSPGLPPRTIGELQVLSVEDHTATTLIARATENIYRGDRVTFSKDQTAPTTPAPSVREPVPAPTQTP